MADLKNLSGLMYLKELERRSRDTLMVYNPTSEDFPVVWEQMTEWVIPNKDKDKGYGPGKLAVPRFIAEKYAREMTTHRINEYAKTKVEEYKKNYNGLPSEWNKIEENIAPRTNDVNLIKKYMKPLVVGMVKEYGFEKGTTVPEAKAPSGQPVEKDIFDELVENLEMQIAEPEDILKGEDAKIKKMVKEIAG